METFFVTKVSIEIIQLIFYEWLVFRADGLCLTEDRKGQREQLDLSFLGVFSNPKGLIHPILIDCTTNLYIVLAKLSAMTNFMT